VPERFVVEDAALVGHVHLPFDVQVILPAMRWAVAGLVLLTSCGSRAAARSGAPSQPPTLAAEVPSSPPAAPHAPPPAPAAVMARIPEGSFNMGSETGEVDEKPVHAVRVRAFDMDATEVTVAAYGACVASGACTPAPGQVRVAGASGASGVDHRLDDEYCNGDRPDRQQHPVNCVDWFMADAYCRWAGKRLPNEEEWEYAARGPQGHAFAWGDSDPSSEVLNACGDECVEAMRAKGQSLRGLYQGSDHWPFTAPVGKYKPNQFGLYDMAGNVWEWTASAYCPYGKSDCGDARRVARGGSWQVVDWVFVRSADRAPYDPSTRNTAIGFRCAR
jgi:formylglycine-generating enzyme required for sulfatase activity